MDKNLIESLKLNVSSYYRSYGDNTVLYKGEESFTGNQIADSVDNEDEFGIEMVNNLVSLTLDLIARGKEKL
jgi:hypothetical protein